MSIEPADRKTLVKLEIAKSYNTMDECELLLSGEKWSGAAGRLYYAVFHAVCALLIHDGHTVRTHKGAGIRFSQQYIHTGILRPEFGELFFNLESIREKSDYDCFYDVKANDVLSRINIAKEMIDTIAAMVKE